MANKRKRSSTYSRIGNDTVSHTGKDKNDATLSGEPVSRKVNRGYKDTVFRK